MATICNDRSDRCCRRRRCSRIAHFVLTVGAAHRKLQLAVGRRAAQNSPSERRHGAKRWRWRQRRRWRRRHGDCEAAFGLRALLHSPFFIGSASACKQSGRFDNRRVAARSAVAANALARSRASCRRPLATRLRPDDGRVAQVLDAIKKPQRRRLKKKSASTLLVDCKTWRFGNASGSWSDACVFSLAPQIATTRRTRKRARARAKHSGGGSGGAHARWPRASFRKTQTTRARVRSNSSAFLSARVAWSIERADRQTIGGASARRRRCRPIGMCARARAYTCCFSSTATAPRARAHAKTIDRNEQKNNRRKASPRHCACK